MADLLKANIFLASKVTEKVLEAVVCKPVVGALIGAGVIFLAWKVRQCIRFDEATQLNQYTQLNESTNSIVEEVNFESRPETIKKELCLVTAKNTCKVEKTVTFAQDTEVDEVPVPVAVDPVSTEVPVIPDVHETPTIEEMKELINSFCTVAKKKETTITVEGPETMPSNIKAINVAIAADLETPQIKEIRTFDKNEEAIVNHRKFLNYIFYQTDSI